MIISCVEACRYVLIKSDGTYEIEKVADISVAWVLRGQSYTKAKTSIRGRIYTKQRLRQEVRVTQEQRLK